MEAKIMIIEDNIVLAKQLSACLKKEGYPANVFLEGASALRELPSFSPDLILLDLHLPGMDGFAVCREIRRISTAPIIVLSVSSDREDKVAVLDLGADDYMVKPPDLPELTARIRAHLRRASMTPAHPQKHATGDYVSYPELLINKTNYTVLYEGRELVMPPRELELLYCLAASPNRVFTREQLLDLVWGYDYIGDARTVDVHIKRIRQKIKDHAAWSITTVWGIGYKFALSQSTEKNVP